MLNQSEKTIRKQKKRQKPIQGMRILFQIQFKSQSDLKIWRDINAKPKTKTKMKKINYYNS